MLLMHMQEVRYSSPTELREASGTCVNDHQCVFILCLSFFLPPFSSPYLQTSVAVLVKAKAYVAFEDTNIQLLGASKKCPSLLPEDPSVAFSNL